LKCRQRKKQWLANLQAKVEIFSSENDALSAQVTQLREEILNLKTILIAHKDCPISQQSQNVGQFMQHGPGGDYGNHANPYSMGQLSQQVMAGPRRYS
jgi:ATF/CREB family transcription factor